MNSSVVQQETPLFIACKNAHPVCVDLLLSHGANMNIGKLKIGATPLMASAREDDTHGGLRLDRFVENRCRCMFSLLSAGAAINLIDNDGRTALVTATWNFQLLKILVEAGANVNVLNKNQVSAVYMAIMKNSSADVVDLLLERGADIDAVDVESETPLHFACHILHSAVVDSLLRHCADIDIVDNYGRTALQLAVSRPITSPDGLAVLKLMGACAQMRLESSLIDWIRLARH